MSAQIPETMLLSDLLKATGYDCPEELQGRTFAEATAGGDVQTNKASTIDVSAYTEPIVIKPDTDYESMKKNTVTLSNIPVVKTEVALEATENKTYTPEEGEVYNSVTVNVPGVTKLYAWFNNTAGDYTYTKTLTPNVGDTTYLTSVGKQIVPKAVAEVVDETHIKIEDVGSSYARTEASAEKDITF